MIEKDKMTAKQIASALYEIPEDDPHSDEIISLLEKKGLMESVGEEVFELYDTKNSPTLVYNDDDVDFNDDDGDIQ
jgi:hypothetical protein